jgi:GNAT superfamily N-acetyltransferase
MRLVVPITPELTEELYDFWGEIFGPPSPDLPPRVLLGHEQEHNRNILYLTRRGGSLAGTCLTTIPKGVPRLAGFGEVATGPRLRGSGIATDLCGQAVDEFRGSGGQAFFLGTGSPVAARIYHRLGWRKLAGANVMANISSGDSPESFFTDYFRDPGTSTIRAASDADRVPMIPLLVSPHDWQVLDANTGMYSTRYRVQHSCMGLYPKYFAITEDGRGTWFSAVTEDGRVVGLATARLDAGRGCQVDGFTHKYHQTAWEPLIQSAIDWGASSGASSWWAAVSAEDEEKQALFESLGFRRSGAGEEFSLEGRTVASVRLERAAGLSPDVPLDIPEVHTNRI